MNILVLGAYGLIGSALARALAGAGHQVTGLGRNKAAMALLPTIAWVRADLQDLQSAEAWDQALDGQDVVVNAAGSLQDGPKDRLEAVHHGAVAALAGAAAARGTKVIQISAAGVAPDASTAFFRSKAAGDAALMASGAEATILRPGLVMARSVYGGTALMRMLAAVPVVQPIALPRTPIQVTGIDDLCQAVLWAVTAPAQPTPLDLVSDTPESLAALTAKLRAWLGFPAARATFEVPSLLTRAISAVADGLGWMGWRSPLRSTAVKVLGDGVRGDPTAWRALTGRPISGLDAILAAEPATVQDRWHARLALLFPILIAGLALFWLASGVIGLIQREAAVAVLTRAEMAPSVALTAVLAGSVVDILLGILVLVKRWARLACLGMVAVSLGYLGAGTLWTPDLWADPLGPFVKVIPAILSALVAWSLLEDR